MSVTGHSPRTVSNPVNNITRLGIVLLATLRLTRLVTTDWLGEWTLVRPLKRWAILGDHREGRGPVEGSSHEVDLHEGGWRSKLVSGLDCGYCFGFWAGALILTGELLTRTRPLRWARPAWTFLTGALGLNYVVGHIWEKLDS